MLALIADGLVLVLVALVGKPYPQSWHERWGRNDR